MSLQNPVWSLSDVRRVASPPGRQVGEKCARLFWDRFRRGDEQVLDLTQRDLFDWILWIHTCFSRHLPEIVGPGIHTALLAWNHDIGPESPGLPAPRVAPSTS